MRYGCECFIGRDDEIGAGSNRCATGERVVDAFIKLPRGQVNTGTTLVVEFDEFAVPMAAGWFDHEFGDHDRGLSIRVIARIAAASSRHIEFLGTIGKRCGVCAT